MNNLSHWPHTTPSISTVPSYVEGYLTPEKFKSQADYDACMNKLLAILYAGYPYNGLNMYTIVDSTTGISEDAFSALLNPPSWIRSDFPDSIGDTVFSYSDYPDNTANLSKLQQFVSDEFTKYYRTGATTPSGHTSAEIRATPFYQAATAMAYAPSYNETPLKVWDLNHSDADTVTEDEAYNATQYAVWAVLGDYSIENNNLNSKNGEVTQKALAVKLLNYATADQVLQAEPDASKVKITGDSQFAYDPEYGVWKTGTLSVTEGANYHGMYTLTLPSGVSAHLLDGTPVSTVSAGTSFYLVSTTKPTATDMEIKASDTLTWLQEYRQYSPKPDTYTASDGKNFQHMIGAVIKQKPLNATLALKPANEGSLTVSKSVVGETNSTTEFTFTVTLKGADGKPLSGTYAYTGGSVSGSSATAPANGTITFDANGAGSVSLSSGQQITIVGIPSGSSYTVEEATSDEDNALKYDVTYNGAQAVPSGTLSADATVAVTNTVQVGTLSVTKHVEGEVNSTKNFTFTVKLGGSGANLTGTYGGMKFSNGVANFTLADGQTKTASNLPAGATYEVTEESNDSYTTTFENAKGTIAKGMTSQAVFTNTRSMSSLPLTGSDGVGPTYLAGIVVLAAAAAWMHIRRNASAKDGDGRD